MSGDKSGESGELEWIRFRQDTLGTTLYPEQVESRFIRKMKENPFVPIGCLATTGALSYGLWSFRKGNAQQSQIMMRTRVAAQGFTVIAMLVGVLLATKNQ